jgi:hypothetical protein
MARQGKATVWWHTPCLCVFFLEQMDNIQCRKKEQVSTRRKARGAAQGENQTLVQWSPPKVATNNATNEN